MKDSSVELVVIGEGNEERKLKDLVQSLRINEKVEFKGYVGHDEINEVYQNSDVFIMPSLSEGMSNSALEAMACGLPIVLTDTGGTSELLNDNGFIVRKKDSGSIREILQKFIKEKELIGRMGKRSREIAVNMGWKNIAEKYYELYSKLGK